MMPSLLMALVGSLMLVLTWGAWPDVLIDFGRELYVPWQLTMGKALYVDLAYLHGPFSPYLNALWFTLGGVSLRTLVVANVVLLALFTGLLYRLLLQLSDRESATIACLVFLTVFAFGHLVGNGNYNFICPYSHELTHGLLLSLLAINRLWSYAQHHRRRDLVWLGLALGAVLLTKIEVFLAAAAAIAAGLGWILRRGMLGAMGLVLGAAALPPLLAIVLLGQTMSVAQAAQGVFGSWAFLSNPAFASCPFYRRWMGLLDVEESVRRLLMWTAGYAAFFGALVAASVALRRTGACQRAASAVVLACAGGFLIWALSRVPLLEAFRPLPIALVGLGVASVVSLSRRRQNLQASDPLILRLILIVFASVLLGKMILYSRVSNYGFALAMPATLLVVLALIRWIPSWLIERGYRGETFRVVGLLAVILMTLAHVMLTGRRLWQKTYLIKHGPDTFLADARGPVVTHALEFLAEHGRLQETLVVMPQGLMLNYLSRRNSAVPYGNFDPLELLFYGEDRMLASLQAQPPDWIALANSNMSEHGSGEFGSGFGRQLDAWIRRHYAELVVIGGRPFESAEFGISLLKRR